MGRKNYNDTTIKNVSEDTVVSPRYDESYQTRKSNAGYPNRTHTPSTNRRDGASNVKKQIGCIPGGCLRAVARR